MSKFRRFVCWREEDLSDVLFADAGAHGQLKGVFAATHRPIPAIREAAGVSTPIHDAAIDALQYVTADVPGTDPVVIPVLGDPGTGKSHLVRWVWTRLEHPMPGRFVVLYVPRVRTSFAGVVELLLKKALEDEDTEVRGMAQSLINYSADLATQDVATVGARLKTEMFGILGRRTSSGGASAALLKDLRTIVIEGGELVDYFASEESAVGRRARRFVDRDDSEAPIDDTGFTREEVEGLSDLCRLGASTPFVEAVRRLVVNKNYGDPDVALRALNWALDQAVAEQMDSGAQGRPTLNVVFRRLRESLQRAGKELVILVEDLKLLHGVERALLEVLIDPAEAIGLEPACRVRALIACTRDPWRAILDDNETLASRLRSWEQPTYTLSVPEEQSREETLAQLDDLAAAYLNAARVGVGRLEEDYESVAEIDRDSWNPPVACVLCPHQTACHSTFGSVRRSDGVEIGLYPFNEQALARAQDLVQRRAGTSIERQLNPRVLLTQVLQPVLRAGAVSLPAKTFPAPELAEKLGVPRSPDVGRRLEAVGYPRDEMARASAALLLWGERTSDGHYELASGIAEGFDLEAPPSIGSEDIVEEVEVGPEPPGPAPPPRDARQQALSEWLNGGVLPQRIANETRQAVLRLILDYVDWADFAGVSARSDGLLRELGLRTAEHSVRIEGAAVGEGEPPAGTTRIELARSEDSYRFLSAALRWPRRTSEGELSGSDLIDLAEGLDSSAAVVKEEARRRGLARAEPIAEMEPAMKALFATSAVLGVPGAESDDPTLLIRALLAPTPTIIEGIGGGISALQATAAQGVRRVATDSYFGDRDPVNRDAARDWLLRRLALRQSPQATDAEAVHAVDAARVIAAVSAVAAATEFSAEEISIETPLPNGAPSFARLASHLTSRLEAALRQETTAVSNWRKSVAQHVNLQDVCDEAGEQWFAGFRASLAALIASLKLVRDTGLVPDGSLYSDLTDEIKALTPLFKDDADETKTSLQRLCRVSSWTGNFNTRELAGLVTQRHAETTSLRRSSVELVQLADRFLIQATNFVSERLAQEDPILAQFDREFAHALDRAADLLEAK